MPKVHGVNASPFVRKVRIALAEKAIGYELVPVMPMGVSAEFRKISPLGKIPVFEADDGFTLPDSSCIIPYLERTQPKPSLYPDDAKDFGWALFLEEYADSKLAETVGGVFFNRVVKKRILKQEPDEARIRQSVEQEMPAHLDYLETRAPEDGDAIVGRRFSIADIGLGSQFVNWQHGGERIDAKRWPRFAAYIDRVHARPSFKACIEEEKAQLGG
ncbi:MAG: glutathione S-transferase family protein [Myxococcota bacterium]